MRIDILSPFTGRVVPLEQVPDPVFAEKMVGDGVAVEPSEGVGRAPAAGKLAVFHAAGHAFAIQVTDEVGVLVHIGLNTVEMKGDGFERKAAVGDVVKAGQEIVGFNLDQIAKAGHSTLSPVILPDLPETYRLEKTTAASVRTGDVLMTITRERLSMPKIAVTLSNKVGLHARPAGALVRVAKEFQSTIKVGHGDKQANAKSILSILALGAERGAEVTLEAEGEDADKALEALRTLIENKFGEGE